MKFESPAGYTPEPATHAVAVPLYQPAACAFDDVLADLEHALAVA